MAVIDIDKVGFIESNRFLNACQMMNVTISRLLTVKHKLQRVQPCSESLFIKSGNLHIFDF